jgi:Flp pilus assembly protein TadD
MKSAAGLMFAFALAGPAAARGLPETLNPRSTGVPASAIAELDKSGQGSAGALGQARALLLGNDPAQALSAFQVALAQAPQSVAALNGIAIAYDRLGRSDLARQHFEMALALEPDAADIAYNLGLAWVRAGQDRAAIPPLQRAVGGNDARVAAAARRTLARIEARLTAPAPAPATMAAVPGGPRIDMASSGEAVLVLAPAAVTPVPAAPVRMAAALPAAAPMPEIAPALSERLGDVAALTIPISLPEPTPETPAIPPTALPHTAALRLMAAHSAAPARTVDADSPALPPGLPAEDRPASPVVVSALVAGKRQPLVPQVLAQWRRAEQADVVRLAKSHRQPAPPPAPPPAPDDDKAAIRLAIARLESLISRIEVHRG